MSWWKQTAIVATLVVSVMSLIPGAVPARAGICDCVATCDGRADPADGLTYDDHDHRLWYEVRFWTGECPDDFFWCFSGESWYHVMDNVLSYAPASDRPALCGRLFTLGIRLGHEWARDNDLRRIETDDLEDWQDQLIDAPDPHAAVTAVEKLVADRLQ